MTGLNSIATYKQKEEGERLQINYIINAEEQLSVGICC